MRTTQELFDIIVSHLRKQGKQALNEDGECVYRTPDGLKCAAGCLIPDELYQGRFEGTGVTNVADILQKHSALLAEELVDAIVLIMQRVHDSKVPELWELEFQRVAHENGLKLQRAS